MGEQSTQAKAKYQLKYGENQFPTLRIRLTKGPNAKKIVAKPGDIIWKGKQVSAKDCGNDAQRAKQINEYFKKLVESKRAVWEAIPDGDTQDTLTGMNMGSPGDQGDDDNSTDANSDTE